MYTYVFGGTRVGVVSLCMINWLEGAANVYMCVGGNVFLVFNVFILYMCVGRRG